MIEELNDKSWRLNNLYRIIDKTGNSIPFKLNPVQQEVLENLHTRNLILKARQLGMSTFSVLYILDQCIFNDNTSAGIVSYSLEHAQHIFKRIIGHALDTLTPVAKEMAGIIQRSAREITFKNGSFLRVDTTLRGGAYQLVLVSEFGKTCARNPVKAEEVITGTLQTVPLDGRIIIESTGEGSDGFYSEMIAEAAQRGNDNLSELEYKLFFFPWFREENYKLAKDIQCPVEYTDYFDKLEKECNVKIDKKKRNWYLYQRGVLKDKVKQEFPSTVKEAFLSTSEAYYFQLCIDQAYTENRMLSISPYDPLSSVFVAMDIGVTDLTVLIFFQVVHGEIRIIDYYKDNNKGLDFYSHFLQQEKPYLYHTIFLPHDAVRKDNIIVENSYEREFRKLFQNTDTKFIVLKRTDKNININNAKIKFSRCVFNINRVKELIEMLGKYRKKWSEPYGKYMDEPFHDISSHYADAFIYAMQAVTHVETVTGLSKAKEDHKRLVENRRFRI